MFFSSSIGTSLLKIWWVVSIFLLHKACFEVPLCLPKFLVPTIQVWMCLNPPSSFDCCHLLPAKMVVTNNSKSDLRSCCTKITTLCHFLSITLSCKDDKDYMKGPFSERNHRLLNHAHLGQIEIVKWNRCRDDEGMIRSWSK
jgi:hypothetical protein